MEGFKTPPGELPKQENPDLTPEPTQLWPNHTVAPKTPLLHVTHGAFSLT